MRIFIILVFLIITTSSFAATFDNKFIQLSTQLGCRLEKAFSERVFSKSFQESDSPGDVKIFLIGMILESEVF